MFRPNILTILPCFFLLSGCAIVAIGAAGLGTFAYVNGKLIKTYKFEYHESVQASKDTLRNLDIPITEETLDESKSIINAKRIDDTPITIEVVRLDLNLTEISVRTGTIGVWNRKISEQIHDYINESLIKHTLHTGRQEGDSVKENVEFSSDQISNKDIAAKKDDNSSSNKIGSVKPGTDLDKEIQNQKPSNLSKIQLHSDFIIYFDQNSNALSNKAIKKLNRIAEIFLRNPKAEIILNGYSDSTGTASFNKMVSESRANSVKIYLVGKGVNLSKIRSVGHGAKNLISTEKTEAGRRLNRRVEVYFNHK